MPAILLLTLLVAPFQAQAKPAPTPSLTGKWTMAIDIQGTTATPSLELVQEGEKITGTYAGRYGKFQLTGTLKGRVLVFTFTMNADGTDQHLVSTGKGRTTCGYFLPDSKHIVYGSTHLAGDACPTPPDRSKGYVWPVFTGYDIVEATDAGKIEKRLTDAPGYDAEATVNWKTGNIVYTSMASGEST